MQDYLSPVVTDSFLLRAPVEESRFSCGLSVPGTGMSKSAVRTLSDTWCMLLLRR
jgi:hypothetical protein